MADNGKLFVTREIQELIDLGALFALNSSGGKDSQCMTIHLARLIPKRQLVIIHSHLPGVEWEGTKEHIEKYAMGIPVHFTQANKTFFEMVDHRRKFPDAARRQCTSDLKRGPIQKFINNYAKENHFNIVVNCMGLRADESHGRAKKEPFRFRDDLSAKHRQQFEWLPIHHFNIHQVWNTITLAGQEPHWAYSEGMTRLSCCFCIMASAHDLKVAARLNPELYKQYVEKEAELGFTLSMSRRTLTEITQGSIREEKNV
jgi:DNA sulfur modification protein DndC